MLKFLFFVIIFFFLVRYINRLFLTSNEKNKSFDPFSGRSNRRKQSFDEIEEAEYEDLSNKEN
ncbi:hypothetical protein [Gracilimonas amylolytica]|uniref:hypothetical protein n=1 Tax=Gracilimonas amylolytica TaxID=1749045 RepID=UPI000CD989DC|nr:hypothetical protein [Gracilimonas amylolytica]